MSLRIAIIETDEPRDDFYDKHGTCGTMFEDWMRPELPDARFQAINLISGSALPSDPDTYDGYLITGSRYGVYDEKPWIVPLRDFLRRLRDRRIPMCGVCFGHQIMADAFGSEVGKSPDGYVLGVETYAGKGAYAIHQDQVFTTPNGAANIMSSPRCKIGRIEYAFPALSVQHHPEFTKAHFSDLMDIYMNMLGKTGFDTALKNPHAQRNNRALATDFAQVLSVRHAANA
ncbi:MAG: type 1 glutamine amidotransferase [Pseudomonadota bacterium]